MDEICLEHGGARLYATASGRGAPVILLHGGLSTHLGVRAWAEPLGARLITPDLRAHGRSWFAGELTWAQLADDVAALMRHLGIARATIGGTSFGAGVAIATALRHPALVGRLAIVHPAFGGGELGLLPAQATAMRAMADAGARGIDGLLALFDRLPEPMRTRARAIVATYDPPSVVAATRFMASGAQPFARGDDVAAIDAPVLLVPGIDPEHPPEVAEVYRRNLRRCTVREGDLLAALADFTA